MSFEYQGFATLGVNLNRQKYGPLDISSVFSSQADLDYYLSKGAITDGVSDYWKDTVPYPYAGQIVALVKEDRSVAISVLAEKEDGTFETTEVGANVDLTAYSTTEEMNQAIEDAVNGIDLSAYATIEYVDEAIAGIVIPEDTDTKTSVVSGDDYIVVDGELTDNTDNTFTVSINVDTLKALIGAETTAAMEFKGAVDYLPLTANKGDVYKVSAAFEVEAAKDAEGIGFTPKVGDSIVFEGEDKWYLIPSGDDIEDTWRPVDGVDGTATLVFEAGNLLEVSVDASGVITYSHAEVEAPVVEADESGTRTYVTGVSTDAYGHVTGYTTATEVFVDTNDIYESGDGIEISAADEDNKHSVSIKIGVGEQNLALSEGFLVTNFNLNDYVTTQAAAEDRSNLVSLINEKVAKVYYEVEQEDGTTKLVEGSLLSPTDREKLDKLAFDENGDVGISGTISVGQVQGLKEWIPQNVTNLTENNLSSAVVEKLNYITSVDDANFKVENGKLELASVSVNQVTDLQSLLDKKVDAEEGSRLLKATEIVLLESLAEGKYDNLVKSVNPNVFSVSEEGMLDIVNVPKEALVAALGNFDTLPQIKEDWTLVDQINNIYEMLIWSELV